MATVTTIESKDIRVSRCDLAWHRVKAAKAAVSFLRRQTEYSRPTSKVELAEAIWSMYWRMEALGLFAAPNTTRSLLRKKYGFSPRPIILT